MRLADWQTAMEEARGRHYFLNYLPVRELCHLVKSVPHILRAVRWQWVFIIGMPVNTTYTMSCKDKKEGCASSSIRIGPATCCADYVWDGGEEAAASVTVVR